MRDDFLLEPGLAFLNHGSFGACPTVVHEELRRWQLELERNPVELLDRRLEGLLDGVRAELAAEVGARAEDLVLVPNATTGLNAAIRSLRLGPEDEVLTTTHEYGALVRTWEYVGARLVAVEPADLLAAIGPRTRVVYASHITSPTALVLPVEELCAAAREAGALSIVDGAHAPGQLDLDLAALGADVYAGNCHKWLCAPRGTAFLVVRPEQQAWVEPGVISWGWEAGSTFAQRHGWQGTRDPAGFLAIPAALAYARGIDRAERRALADEAAAALAALGLGPAATGEPAPLMRAVALPGDAPPDLKERLLARHGVEVWTGEWKSVRVLRFSIGPYVTREDCGRLLDALGAQLHSSSERP
jgi:isopenicillin-N epimerase